MTKPTIFTVLAARTSFETWIPKSLWQPNFKTVKPFILMFIHAICSSIFTAKGQEFFENSADNFIFKILSVHMVRFAL
jgi:hypothetical protein